VLGQAIVLRAIYYSAIPVVRRVADQQQAQLGEPSNEFGLAVTAAVIDRAVQGLDRMRQRDVVRSVGHDVRSDVSFELRNELVAERSPRGGVLRPG
jgi:hypothetical protein